MEVSVSILNSINRIKDVEKLNNTKCDYIHIDIMDGIFVDNKQFTISEVIDIIKSSQKKIDIHLMVNNPLEYIDKLKGYNINNITFHEEITQDKHKLIKILKDNNIKVGIALKPNTKIDSLIDYINDIDIVLIMSVEPGYGGQEFIESSLDKVRELKKIINPTTKIEIDGGVKDININQISTSGVDISVVGSFITKSDDFNRNIEIIKNPNK